MILEDIFILVSFHDRFLLKLEWSIKWKGSWYTFGHSMWVSTSRGFRVVFQGLDCWCVSITRNGPAKKALRNFCWVENVLFVREVLKAALLNFWMEGWWCDDVIQPCNVYFAIWLVFSHLAPPLYVIQTANWNATVILCLSNIFCFILVCFSIFLLELKASSFVRWQRVKAVRYHYHVFWNDSLHATGPVTMSGDTKAEGAQDRSRPS